MKNRWNIVFLLLGASLFAILVFDFGIGNIVNNLVRLGWWFLPIVAVWGVVYWMNAGAWYAILRDMNAEVGFGRTLVLTVTGFAINYVTPFLNLGGEPYRVLALKEPIGLHKAVSSVILYNMVRWLAHGFFWLLAIVLVALTFPLTPLFAISLALVFALVSLVVLFFFTRHKKGIFSSLLLWVPRVRLLKRLAAALHSRRGPLLRIDDQIRHLYNNSPGVFAYAVLLEVGSRVVASLEFYFIFLAIGLDASLIDALYVNAASSLILNLLFFIPFELGTREGGLYMIMQTLGWIPGIGIVLGLVNRLRELFWILVGLIGVSLLGGKHAQGPLLDLMETHSEP